MKFYAEFFFSLIILLGSFVLKGECSSFCVPKLPYAFEARVSAMDVKPWVNPLEFPAFNEGKIQKFKPSYAFGFDLDLGYAIPCRGNDIRAHWTHFNSHVKRHFFELLLENDSRKLFNVSRTRASHVFDAASLTLGQYLQFGQCLRIRLLGGVAFMSLKQNVAHAFHLPEITDDELHFSSHFTGIGSQLGLWNLYSLGKGFGLSLEVKGALLFGHLHQKRRSNHDSEILMKPRQSASQRASFGFDGKFGVNYAVCFYRGLIFSIEAGFLAALYTDVSHRAFSNDLTHFSYGGPYATMNFEF